MSYALLMNCQDGSSPKVDALVLCYCFKIPMHFPAEIDNKKLLFSLVNF